MNNKRIEKNGDYKKSTIPWYKEGLRFECQRCGNCCRGEPGAVWVDKSEMARISSFLGIALSAFAKNYLRKIYKRFSLLEYGNGDCIMYRDGCRIYTVRPCQCRTFPFWKLNLESKSEWEKRKETCPGIDRGKLYSLKDIEENLEIFESGFG
ncbi:MAG: YkgJ family cysteine cluster protein [Candidatus Brocadiaceae bacterium]|nr:YkgJ family cysteine cluster protein [Candidatus Brocadiaceae bacterium]